MAQVYHALGLNMHQPLGNLLGLHNSAEQWEARQILWCYDRPTRMLEGYEDVAGVHMSMSGTLLKQLEDSAVRETFHDVTDIDDMLARYRRSPIEFLGTGLYHPVYPLIPASDWDAQTAWWQGLGRHLLGREHFRGFWPPELAFSAEMIPMLKRHGYDYVVVDCWYIKPKREMSWQEVRYRPHIARYDGAEIVVVPRDRELSAAQQSGVDPGWFQSEVAARTRECDFPALVTTWTDGENGGWFRTTSIESGFWGHFYRPILDWYRAGDLGFAPTRISDYLQHHWPEDEVDLYPGAWNTGDHWGGDFRQWSGSLLQKKGWDEVRNASAYCASARRAFDERADGAVNRDEIRQLMTSAYDHILVAETSCNYFWGSQWVHRSFDELERAYGLLDQAMAQLPG